MAKNPLIDVEFVDNTSYAQTESTDDIVGVVVETAWGKPDSFIVMDQVAWNSFANPAGGALINQSYATVNRLFNSGARYIEAYRPLGSNKYLYVVVTSDGSTLSVDSGASTLDSYNQKVQSAVTSANYMFAFRTKYPCNIPMKVTLSEYAGRVPSELSEAELFNISVEVLGASTQKESFVVSPKKVSLSGVSYFIADVFESKSNWLSGELEFSSMKDMPESDPFTSISPIDLQPDAVTPLTKDEYVAAYSKFADRERSSHTILVSTFDPNAEGAAEVYAAIAAADDERMDAIALTGVPKSCFESTDEETIKENIKTATVENTSLAGYYGKFVGAIAAAERIVLNNSVFYLDGTATWAGRMCAVAYEVKNRNQLPSYKAYGKCATQLVASLSFNNVVSLMEEYGISSIYSSSTGNYIFGIRSMYSMQESYFGKLNVMRVTAAVLRWLLDDVESVIHTDVTSDASQRLAFQDRCNQKLSQMIARGELKSDSYISCGNDINTDELTQGGECLNIEAYLWYKKLTERVKISIIATDTSVDVNMEE